MTYLPNILFIAALATAIAIFAKKVGRIRKNIGLGKDTDRTDR